jgi:multidrug efflux pump subunit AcrA (membrane-fusion protein)
MTLLRRYFWFMVVGTIVVCVIYAMTAQTQQRPAPGGRFRGGDVPVPVLAASAIRADVPVYLDGVGTTRALNTVTVRPQIDGKLMKILFKEGQDVERGYVLAEIDPTIYQAQLDQAKAKKAQDEAQLANAGSISNAIRALPHPTPSTASRSTRKKRWSNSSKRRSSSIRRRSTMPRPCSATPRSSRRFQAAPASGSSTWATSCACRTRPASS